MASTISQMINYPECSMVRIHLIGVGLAHKSRMKSLQSQNIKIVKKVAHLTGNNVHQVRGQRLMSPGQLMLKPKVCHLRTSNLVGGWSMRYQLPWPVIKALLSWVVIARGTVEYRLGHTHDSHTTCLCTVWEITQCSVSVIFHELGAKV